MKSMLYEASSVAKAVEKAWTDAGKPTEFTIKVLEVGEKKFFGLSKTPAIVSITYELRKQAMGKSQEHRPSDQIEKNVAAQRSIAGAKNQETPLPKRDVVKPAKQRIVQQPKEIINKEIINKEKSVEQSEVLVWSDEMVSFVAKELKELLVLWGTKPEFSSKVDKKVLTIMLDGRLHDDAAEERNVFMGFSYLLVQLLKRHYKKKFRGFQLIITAPKGT